MAKEGSTNRVTVYCADSKCIHRLNTNGEEGVCTNKGAVRNAPAGCDSVRCDSCAMSCHDRDLYNQAG